MNGCFKAVYYGVPFRGARLAPAFGRTTIFEYNRKRCFWASLFAVKLRNAWHVPHDAKNHTTMLAMYHHRMPNWMWKLQWDSDSVRTIRGDFEGKTLAQQIKVVSQVHGIISIGGASFTWQLFLSPRSPLFQFGLSTMAMGPKAKNR